MKRIICSLTLLLLSFVMHGQNNQWVWMKGDSMIKNTNYGIYGQQGVGSVTNRPGSRSSASTWTDASGIFWLFGGSGYAESGSTGYLNDLWKYNPATNQWTWVKGDKTIYINGVYGTINVASVGNKPGSRRGASQWFDQSGNLWLFGGEGMPEIGNSTGKLNDLWRYNTITNEWTWVKGDKVRFVNGVYGTINVGANANKPGSREFAVSWADNSGNLWLFGGNGYEEINTSEGRLNDLWRYNLVLNQWTWMKGDKTRNMNGVYGSVTVSAVPNKPGGREGAVAVRDPLTNFIWLFGGFGYPETGTTRGILNDLWRYNPVNNQWTWMKGDKTLNNLGIYGIQGTGAAANKPGSRYSSTAFRDGAGSIWIFSGNGLGESGSAGSLNDVWRYNTALNQWTWMKGDKTSNPIPVYGTAGNPAVTNKPGGMSNSMIWVDAANNMWVFGGSGRTVYINEMWKYNTLSSEWTWIRDIVDVGSSGVYGTLNIASIANNPGSRMSAMTWTDQSGDMWLFGGEGKGGLTQNGYLNDLWKYEVGVSQWAWIKGDSLADVIGSYGIQGTAASTNHPGARNGAVTWVDNTGQFWMFGGYGFNNITGTSGYLNDLWKFNKANLSWTWVKGTNVLNVNGVYGSQGIPANTNNPGGRRGAVSWKDNAGNLWLYGGDGLSENASGYLSDLWKYNISTNQWTWMNGEKVTNVAGLYSVLGSTSPDNKPGSRLEAFSWKDNDGNFWIFGGNFSGHLSDIWKYDVTINQWAWMGGNSNTNEAPVYGTKGVASILNTPGGRQAGNTWVSVDGDLYLFGGTYYSNYFNDVWKYNRSSGLWAWVNGPASNSNTGVYGTKGIPNAANTPGSRYLGSSWIGSTGDFWLFGGNGIAGNPGRYNYLNDLWKIKPCEGVLSLTPLNGSFCNGTNSISLTVSGGSGSYEWYKDGVLIPGQTSSTFTATVAGSYYAKTTGGVCELFSQEVILGGASVAPGLGGNGVYCEGVNVNVGIPDTENDQDYEWQGPASYYVPIGGGGGNQSLNFAMAASYSGTYIVESRKPNCDTVYSNPVSVYYGGITNLGATSVCANQVSFSWRDYGSPVKRFQYAVTLFSNPPANGSPTSSTSAAAGGLLPSTTYFIHVRGATIPNFDLSQLSFCNDWATIFFTTPAAPATPTLSPVSATICQGNSQLLTASGGNSYQWLRDNNIINGVTTSTYTATLPGVYRVRAYNSGCDQSTPLSNVSTITVNPPTTSTTNIGICSNQLPFNWNGNNYNTAGTYNVTLTTGAGCDSIATLNLTIAPPLTSTTNFSVCTNQLPYNWNGNNYNSAGTYNVSLLGSNGCDSIATLNLTIKPISTSITNTAVCSNLLPFNWNGNNYSIAGTYNVTLVAANGCDSIATLNLSVNAASTSTTNVSICNNQLPYTWNGNSYIAGGIYNITLPGTNGCDSIATLNLSVSAVLTSTTNASVCTNQLPFVWNGNNYNTAGSFNVTLVSQSGCDSIATLNLTINPLLTSTTNVAVCSNQLPYSWNGNNYNSGGSYSITLLGSTGCDSTATLNLSINQTSSSTTNVTVCSNLLPYSWNSNNYTAAGTYNVTLIAANGCDSIATLNLSVNTALTSTTNASICTNQLPYSWNGNSYNAAGIYNVTLVATNGCDSIATLNLAVSTVLTSTTNASVCANQLPYVWNGNNYNTAGTFNVTLVSQSGCDSIATLNLSINPLLTSTTNAAVCSNQLPYSWNGNNYSSPGIYNVTLPGSNGCDSISTLNLSINSTSSSITNASICSNQLPYNWNGNNYNASGNYNVTLVGANGCDSIATLNLTVKAVQTSTTNVSICNNQLPYIWNGNSYSLAGNYNVTLAGSNGCDSIATLNLSIGAVLTSTTNVNVCANQLPYSWNGNNYTTAGSFNVTLVSQAGCDSIATLNLGVTPVLTSVTNITRCANQLPYVWNGNNYSATGIYNITLAGSNGCDSIASLNLTVNPVLTSITNISSCANQLPFVWNGNNYTATGTYNVTLLGSNGCDSVATLNFVVKPVLTSTTNIEVCTNQLPFSWNGNNYNTAGNYNITLVGTNGCDSIATLNLAIKPVATSTTSISICANQLPFNWNGNSYTASGNYNVILTGANNCDSTATLILTVNALPNGSISPGNTTICVGSSQILTVSGGVSYQWFLNGTPVNGATADAITVTTQGIYSVQITAANGCKAMASNTAIIQVIQKPISAFDFSALCQNEPATFNNRSTTGSSGTINWRWNFGDNSTSSLFGPSHVYTQPGFYTVELIATPAACPQLADTIKQAITVLAATPGIRYDNVRVLKNTAFTLSARNIGVQYVWQPGTGLNNSSIQNPIVTTSADREYLVRIRTAAGCLVTDTLLVQAFDKADIYVPKAFTPNNNNANDKLRPLAVSVFSIDYFRVYNRWGQLMYQTQNVGEGWDGNYKNIPQPTETYTWVFLGKSQDGTILKASGKTVLIR